MQNLVGVRGEHATAGQHSVQDMSRKENLLSTHTSGKLFTVQVYDWEFPLVYV